MVKLGYGYFIWNAAAAFFVKHHGIWNAAAAVYFVTH